MSRRSVRWLVSALATFAFVAMLAPGAHAQGGTVTGQVTAAATGAPLPGVRILLDGTNVSAVTGEDGRYTLRNVAEGRHNVLAITIGYQSGRTDVSVVGGSGSANFVLSPAVVSLDDIVVTATGEQRKRELANSVTNIDAVAAVEMAPQNFVSMIQGRAAGVQILSASGTAGTSNRIRIRGASSINLTNEPLLVVDGIRVENSQSSIGFGVGGQDISRLNDFNPEDIANIEIVKGPSAAALYGLN